VNSRQEHAECSIVIAAGVDRIGGLVSHPDWFVCHGPEAPAVIDGVEQVTVWSWMIATEPWSSTWSPCMSPAMPPSVGNREATGTSKGPGRRL
jgi:hypothetical protein